MDKIIISSCLLGNNTKYVGTNNYIDGIEALKEKYIIIPICPEVMGGLSIPREPSEIKDDKVISKAGNDVTKYFKAGCNHILKLIENEDIKFAILKDGSPSCGVNYIYDGTFTKNKIKGNGLITKELIKKNIKIYSEHEIGELLC